MSDGIENRSEQDQPDLERLSEALKDQVQRAKDRIADRYTRLVEDRPFASPGKSKA